jgi:hypothetical protein
MYWVSHKPSHGKECVAPDFVWFNKRAASARVTTARDLAFYRKENDNYTPRYGDSFKAATPRAKARSSTPRGNPERPSTSGGFAYGKKVRPSTPIDEVISHRFAEQAEDELRRFYTDYRDQQESGTSQVRKIHLTNAAHGHATNAKKAYQQQEEEVRQDSHFKINKFRHIHSQVDSGRNNGRRQSANAILAQLGKAKEQGTSQASDLPERLDDEDIPPGACETA